MIIYCMENTINGKKYIGQTNNFKLRMNGHRSDANNPNSHAYNYPLALAIRNYGWEAFNNYIIEEINDEADWEYVDERERYYIQLYSTQSSKSGYNITAGGQGCPRPKLTYEQKLKLSKIFSPEEIMDIQDMMKKGLKRKVIMNKYPQLTFSYFDNINLGLNFKNDEWEYPLHKYEEDDSRIFDQEQILEIKKDIANTSLSYKEISKKWNLSLGLISSINNGGMWHDADTIYPLSERGHSRIHNYNLWVKQVQYDLMHSNLKFTEISEKYDKAYSTIKKINSGASYKDKNYKYPLTKNRKNN